MLGPSENKNSVINFVKLSLKIWVKKFESSHKKLVVDSAMAIIETKC